MKLKAVWILFFVSLVTIVPFKLYSTIAKTGMEKSLGFSVIITAILIALELLVFFSKEDIRSFKSQKNFFTAICAAIISLCFLWSGISYLGDHSNYDFKLQPLIMFVLSVLSFITFIMVSLNFFIGKNMFKKAQVMVFFPALWFGVEMIAFLSISNSSPDPYNVALKSFMVLFTFYHTQLFVTATDKNILKRLFAFGIPSIVLAIMYNIPVLIQAISDPQSLGMRTISSASMELILAIYITSILIGVYNQESSKSIKYNNKEEQ